MYARRQLQALVRQQARPDRIRIQQGVQLRVVAADVSELCVPHRCRSGGEDDERTLWSYSDIVGALQENRRVFRPHEGIAHLDYEQVKVTGIEQGAPRVRNRVGRAVIRSEEHTSELQSPCNLVCRL